MFNILANMKITMNPAMLETMVDNFGFCWCACGKRSLAPK